MEKGKYEYYNSKLVTKKAEALRDEYLRDVSKHFKDKKYRHLKLSIRLDEDVILIEHKFEIDGYLRLLTARDFYTLYNIVTN